MVRRQGWFYMAVGNNGAHFPSVGEPPVSEPGKLFPVHAFDFIQGLVPSQGKIKKIGLSRPHKPCEFIPDQVVGDHAESRLRPGLSDSEGRVLTSVSAGYFLSAKVMACFKTGADNIFELHL